MIDLFLEYAGQKIVEARAAQVAGNLTGVEKAVHPIKSSAGNVGARRIQELALQIEELARQGHSRKPRRFFDGTGTSFRCRQTRARGKAAVAFPQDSLARPGNQLEFIPFGSGRKQPLT